MPSPVTRASPRSPSSASRTISGGERVHAVVVRSPGASVTEDELIDHARASIAGYKVPKSIEFRHDPLPLSGAMKPLKRQLREEYLRSEALTASG